MARKKVSKPVKSVKSVNKGWGGFSNFQLAVVFAVLLVFVALFLM